ncbi:hypothetical protein [[Phormidium] sp. ETS-05]|uniref:hypothetical protein n=1 Tax=[Phormidium] sp. ETS-05 TaxID=222819 RepID=UPI0018EF27DE|nr:hypothetical protein [[Phormidium] sp. ETS-05]
MTLNSFDHHCSVVGTAHPTETDISRRVGSAMTLNSFDHHCSVVGTAHPTEPDGHKFNSVDLLRGKAFGKIIFSFSDILPEGFPLVWGMKD